MKWPRAKVDEYFGPTLEDDAIGFRDLLAYPKNEHVFKDGVYLDRETPETCLAGDDTSFIFKYDQKTDCGGMDFNTRRENDSRDEVYGGLLPEVGGKEDLHAINSLSNTYVDVVEKGLAFDYAPCKDSGLEKYSKFHSQGFSKSDIGAIGPPDLSMATHPVLKSHSSVRKGTAFDLHGTSRSKCDFGRPVDKLHGTSGRFGNAIYENKTERICSSDSTSESTPCSFTSACGAKVNQRSQGINKEDLAGQDVSKNLSVSAGEIGKFSPQKRSRRPPKRYIEEFPYQKSRCVEGKGKISSKPYKDKCHGVRSQNEHHHVTFGVLTLASGREATGRAGNEAPFDFQLQNEFRKRSASFSDSSSDEDSTATGSEDNHVITKKSAGGADRRKNQRLWTHSEVMKLVDGVSQHGVGRWTEIKRLLFSSSAYRTPIDLRDKWRNLIKASHAQLRDRREVEPKRASNLLPKSLLQRISELATVHPYPRDRKSKTLRVSRIAELNPSRISEVTELNASSDDTELNPSSHVTELNPSRISHGREFNPGRIPVKLY